MKGFLGGLLIGAATVLIRSHADKWWVLYAGIFSLLFGINFLIEDKIESAVHKLKND